MLATYVQIVAIAAKVSFGTAPAAKGGKQYAHFGLFSLMSQCREGDSVTPEKERKVKINEL